LLRIGILALQGAFIEHQYILNALDVDSTQVRLPEHLKNLDGLIIPGGESTTIGKLAVEFGLLDELRSFGKDHAIWGTCAGAIFLSKDIARPQPLLNLMDIAVERNAFGRQISSFETDLDVPALKSVDKSEHPFHAVFIRAPLIQSIGEDVQIIASLPDGVIVAAREGHWLATVFHPELTNDDRFHRYFLEMVKSN
jgi:pyridoxal 5'-phosphate synthase pdxT subunit